MTSSIATSVLRFVTGRLMPKIAYPVLAGPLRGTRIVLGSLSGPGGGASVYLGRVEPEQTAAICHALRPAFVVYDVGANVGYYSLLASRLIGSEGRVIAFEPDEQNLDYLRRHIRLNRIDNIHVIAAAVSDKTGTLSFSQTDDRATGHINPDGEIRVAATTIDHTRTETGLDPDVIKIDVEGAEFEVLTGAVDTLAHIRPVLFLSTHSAELREKCLDYLRSAKYDVKPVLTSGDAHEFIARPQD